MRLVIAIVLGCCLLVASPADCGDEMRLGSIVLSLGQTPADVERQLGADARLEFARDTLPGNPAASPTEKGVRYETRITTAEGPVRIQYDDEYGEHARLLWKDASESAVVFLVFEKGRLTRITRLIGGANLQSASSSALMQSLADVLATWDGERPITVTTSAFEKDGLREISFASGPRRLTLTETPALLQVVENLGRGDLESVTTGSQ